MKCYVLHNVRYVHVLMELEFLFFIFFPRTSDRLKLCKCAVASFLISASASGFFPSPAEPLEQTGCGCCVYIVGVGVSSKRNGVGVRSVGWV